MPKTTITIYYSAVDGFTEVKRFKTIGGAQRYAQKLVGESPTIGSYYAVSDDGIGKVEVSGATMKEVFPNGF